MRAPTDTGQVASHYAVLRANGAMHWGDDMPGLPGMNVYAPEDGIVTAVVYGKGTSVALPPPWNGYGPGVVEIRGASGVWHVLAHVHPGVLAPGVAVHEGEVVGTLPMAVGAAGPHVHWEVRTGRAIDSPSTRGANTIDPQLWLTAGAPAAIAASAPAGSGWGVLLVLLLLFAAGGKR
jgi:murein DD-endopeptidase MepM/ murein hydrolase activator NlpD